MRENVSFYVIIFTLKEAIGRIHRMIEQFELDGTHEDDQSPSPVPAPDTPRVRPCA